MERNPIQAVIEDERLYAAASQRVQRARHLRLRATERRTLLFAGDLASAILALLVGLLFWASKDWLHFSLQFLQERPPFWFYLLPVLWLLLLVELYEPRRASRRSDVLLGVFIAAMIISGLYLVIYFVLTPGGLPRVGVVAFILSASILTVVWRFAYIGIFTAPRFMRRVLIIGAGKAGRTLVEIIRNSWPLPFYLVGLIDDDPQKIGSEIGGYKVLGGNDQLLEIIAQEDVSDLICAISGEMQGSTFQSILLAEEQGVEVTTMPAVYEQLLGRVPIFHLESDWILRSFVDRAHASGLYDLGKRLMDIAGGLIGVMIGVVLFPFIGLAIVIDSGFPIFFSQYRLGVRGRPFKVYKFRTMVQDSESDGIVRVTTRNDERITRVGHFLRRTHLDELPQMVNVLRGEMSLVGPRAERAELVEQLQEKIPFYRARLLVKPGITGWAQVNFGYAATIEDTAIKLEYDLYYIKQRNFLMDLLILLRTPMTVIGLKGQ
jgi:exopolysaccharide biosynthesis polyprenyl glycosylphosphotransferase